jgi:hypothetical protein
MILLPATRSGNLGSYTIFVHIVFNLPKYCALLPMRICSLLHILISISGIPPVFRVGTALAVSGAENGFLKETSGHGEVPGP